MINVHLILGWLILTLCVVEYVPGALLSVLKVSLMSEFL